MNERRIDAAKHLELAANGVEKVKSSLIDEQFRLAATITDESSIADSYRIETLISEIGVHLHRLSAAQLSIEKSACGLGLHVHADTK